MVNDFLSDVLTRLRNAQRAGHKTVSLRRSKMAERVLEVLKREGFIDTFERKKKEEGVPGEKLEVYLKYFSSGDPAMGMIRRVSRPGRRVYTPSKDIPRMFAGLGISIISTSQGVMSDREARRRKLGGEVLALVG